MQYHKIETLYERDEKTHRLIQPLILKNPVYGILKEWEWTEKIDGTNIRVMWDVSDRTVRFGGKTDAAQIDTQLLQSLQDRYNPAVFGGIFPDSSVILYGEGYGAGIQKGGGYRATKGFILFDVLVSETWWLNWENVCDVATKLYTDTVPFMGRMSLEYATEMVKEGFPSKLNGGVIQAEGLVGRPQECLFDKKHTRLITKIKTKDF